jgi:hypothetical protein
MNKFKLVDVGDGWSQIIEHKPIKVVRKRINSQDHRPTLSKKFKKKHYPKHYHFKDDEE